MNSEKPSNRPEMFLSICAFLFAIAAGVTFLHVYWTTPETFLMGWVLALSLALFGISFVLWGHAISVRKEASQEREVPESDEEDLQKVREEFYPAQEGVECRRYLYLMGTAVLAFFAAIVVSFFRAFAHPPDLSLFGVIWKSGDRLITLDGKPVPTDALVPGSFMVVFPPAQVGSVHAQTVLVRVHPDRLRLPSARSNWAPMGYVAYSRVCTHAGCPVGEFQAESNLLLCPCHQSTFSVLESGHPTGGPAARELPQLPLYAGDDGFLHAAGDFSSKPGPGFWRY